MSTLQRVYQIVSAHLYRAESRSAVAEQAWADATAENADRGDLPEEAVVGHIRLAQSRAVAAIAAGNHPHPITGAAVDTLDHAVYAAVAEIRRQIPQHERRS